MSDTDNPIDFKPITPGLGFHPFSDGLPYAPVSKTTGKDLSAGTGAIAAGPATFRFPQAPTRYSPHGTGGPKVNVPVAQRTRSEPQLRAPATRTVEAKIAAPVKPETAFGAPTYGFLYLIKRMLAYTLDSALNTALLGAGLSLGLWNQDLNPDMLMNPGVVVISVLFFTLFNWALITAQEVAFGTSVGKRIFGLALRGGTAAIFLRAFFFLPSMAFCGIGLLWSVLDRQKRCWHDLVVNIQPIEIAKL